MEKKYISIFFFVRCRLKPEDTQDHLSRKPRISVADPFVSKCWKHFFLSVSHQLLTRKGSYILFSPFPLSRAGNCAISTKPILVVERGERKKIHSANLSGRKLSTRVREYRLLPRKLKAPICESLFFLFFCHRKEGKENDILSF